MNTEPTAPTRRFNNRLLMNFRKWHVWLGGFMSVLILIVCLTGIYLNHQDLFTGGPPVRDASKVGAARSNVLTTATDLGAQPVSFAAALARARTHWGDIPVANLQLKEELGVLVYKIKSLEGREIAVNAMTGALTKKEGYRKYEQPAAADTMTGGYNWGRIMRDLHTGKLFGEAGKLFVDATSLSIIALTLTGVCLWAAPKCRKRKAAGVCQTPGCGAEPAAGTHANRSAVVAHTFTKED